MTKYFINWSTEDITAYWNSERWDFKAGAFMLLQEHLANHFANKLVDRELQKLGLQVDDASREELVAKCSVVPEGETLVEVDDGVSSEKVEAFIIDAEDKKKRKPKTKKVSDDSEFEGA